MEDRYFVVEAWEMREQDPTPHHVHTRLHFGTKEAIGRFWSAWNEKNFPIQRIDRVVAERETVEEAMNDLRSHVAWRKRQKDLAGCTDKISSVGCADSSP